MRLPYYVSGSQFYSLRGFKMIFAFEMMFARWHVNALQGRMINLFGPYSNNVKSQKMHNVDSKNEIFKHV